MKQNPIFLQPHDTCFCPSGKQFADCCGSTEADRSPPWGVQVIPSAIKGGNCDALVRFAQKRPKVKLWAVENNAHGGQVEDSTEGRITKLVDLGKEQEKINKLFGKILLEHVEPRSGCKIEWFEHPQLMCYTKGGWYGQHCDNASQDPHTGAYVRSVDRDISLLLYLNDDYEGGSLSFPAFNYTYQPRKGDLLFFPSDARYLHQANEVTSGTRYVIVSWIGALGGMRVPAYPEGRIILNAPTGT